MASSRASSVGLRSIATNMFSTNVQTRLGQIIQLLKMVILTIIPSGILVTFIGIELTHTVKVDLELKILQHSIDESKTLGEFIHNLQLEMEDIVYHFAHAEDNSLNRQIYEQYAKTDIALDGILWWPINDEITESDEFKNRENFRTYLNVHRDEFFSLNSNVHDAIIFYERINLVFIKWFTTSLQETENTGNLWKLLLAFKYVIKAKENTGIMAAYGQEYLMGGNIPHEDYVNYISNDVLADDHLESCFRFSEEVENTYHQILNKEINDFHSTIEPLKQAIKYANSTNTTAVDTWHDVMAEYLIVLKHVEDKIIILIADGIEGQKVASKRQVSSGAGAGCGGCGRTL